MLIDPHFKAFQKNTPMPIKLLTDLGYDCNVGFMADYICERVMEPLKFIEGDLGETTRIEFMYNNIIPSCFENKTNRKLPLRLDFKEVTAIYEIAKVISHKYDNGIPAVKSPIVIDTTERADVCVYSILEDETE